MRATDIFRYHATILIGRIADLAHGCVHLCVSHGLMTRKQKT